MHLHIVLMSSVFWEYNFPNNLHSVWEIFGLCWPRVCLTEAQFSSVQLLSHVRFFATPWIAACQASLFITNSQSLLKLMPIQSVMPSSHLILCRPPPAPNPSQHQGLFQWVNFSHEVAKVLEFQLQHQSFRWTPRTDLLAVQGTLKSLLQHHSSKASIFWCSAFFTVQLSHPYMTTGETRAYIGVTYHG